MRLYHRTTRDAARGIVAHGFRNAWGYYLTDRLWYGVWLSDVPLETNQNMGGDALLAVDLAVPDAELADYAWVDLTKPYREFLLLAEFITQHGIVSIVACE